MLTLTSINSNHIKKIKKYLFQQHRFVEKVVVKQKQYMV